MYKFWYTGNFRLLITPNSCKSLQISQLTLEIAMWLYSNFIIKSNESDTSKRYIMVLPLLWNACWGIYFVLFFYPLLFPKWLPLSLPSSSPFSCFFFSDNRLSLLHHQIFLSQLNPFHMSFLASPSYVVRLHVWYQMAPHLFGLQWRVQGLWVWLRWNSKQNTKVFAGKGQLGPFGSFLLSLVQNAPVLDHQLWISSSQTLCSTSQSTS